MFHVFVFSSYFLPQDKTKNARLKNPSDLLHKNLMNYPCIVCHLTPIGKFQCSFIQIILSITILDVNAHVV